MKEIPLYEGGTTLVDDEDYQRVISLGYIWHKKKNSLNRTWYAVAKKKRRDIPLHRLIMNAPDSITVDHVNHNGLDNQKANLRFANHSQQGANREIFKNNKSGYKGVHWDKDRRNWRAEITANGKKYRLGRFVSAIDAARAYDAAAVELFGEFAYTNCH